MKFNLVRPCDSCPFRTDKPFYLTPERAREISEGLLGDKTFACHRTVDYDRMEREGERDEEDPPTTGAGRMGSKSDPCLEDLHRIYDEPPAIPGDKNEQHCAGAAIILERLERPNQWMRISERLGFYDRTKLDMGAPVFADFDEFIEFQEQLEAQLDARRRVGAAVKPKPKPKPKTKARARGRRR
jgi:hypothetical protein